MFDESTLVEAADWLVGLVSGHPYEALGAAALAAACGAFRGARAAWAAGRLSCRALAWAGRCAAAPFAADRTPWPGHVQAALDELARPGAQLKDGYLVTGNLRVVVAAGDRAASVVAVRTEGQPEVLALLSARERKAVLAAVRAACKRVREEDHAYACMAVSDALAPPSAARNCGAHLALVQPTPYPAPYPHPEPQPPANRPAVKKR